MSAEEEPKLPSAAELYARVYTKEQRCLDRKVREELAGQSPLDTEYQASVYVNSIPADVVADYELKLKGEGYFTRVEYNNGRKYLSISPKPFGGVSTETQGKFLSAATGAFLGGVLVSVLLRRPPV